MLTRRRATIIAVSLGVAMVAACSGDGGEGAQEPSSSADALEAPQDEGRWLPLLRVVPDTADARGYVLMADLAAAAEAAGADRPAADASNDEVLEYFMSLSYPSETGGLANGIATLFDWSSRAPQDDESYRAEMGWSLTQVDQAVQAGIAPESYAGFAGDFDPEAVDAVLAEVPYWSDIQETVAYGDAEYYRWGADSEASFDHVSPARPVGIGGRMLVGADMVLLTRSDAAMEAMIDAEAGTNSLADVEDFALIAAALEDEPVFSTVITDDILEPGPDDDAPALQGVEAYGTAWGADATDGVTNVLVLVSANADDAEANVELFTDRIAEGASTATEQPYRQVMSVERTEVDGRVTTFWLDTELPRYFVDSMLRRDPLVANGG